MRSQTLLPVIISVPHGGTKIPKEARSYCRLDMKSILRDGDTWSRELYALSDRVIAYLETDIARAVIDMNRAPDDLPPENPDGVVKTNTVDNVQVWISPDGPPERVRKHLIRKYHTAYHDMIQRISREREMVLGIDCHTMLPSKDEIFRPMICISNRGDKMGEAIGEPTTAPADLVLALRDALSKVFLHENVEIKINTEPVMVNDPFRGGYILKRHGGAGSIPWIQFEINRALYMPREGRLPESPDRKTLKRLSELREKFLRALKSVL